MGRLTKTEQVKMLFLDGSSTAIAKAFGMLGRFRLGLSKEESRALQITHEVLTGSEAFYRQIGVDIDAEMQSAKAVVRRIFGIDVDF